MDFLDEKETKESQWISISDLMSVLMMIFLFIAVSYMINVVKEKEKIKEIAVTYNKLQNELYKDLEIEFRNDLENWDAEIDKKTLSVRFRSPDVLFAPGSSVLKPQFKDILGDFFPRYIEIVGNTKYRNDIEEIRIEGHTSSEWNYEETELKGYFHNMELSQNRTRQVLEFVLGMQYSNQDGHWMREKVTANGLSSSKPILEAGKENKRRSRRVEFRVRTNAEERIAKIITTDS